MNSFIYDIPTKVYFGENQLGHLGEELSRYGKKVLLTYGGGSIKKSGLYDKVVAEIKKAGLELFELSGIEPNPKSFFRKSRCRTLQKRRHRGASGGGRRIRYRLHKVHRRSDFL